MDGSEIIKTGPAIAKGVAEIIAAVPLADIVKRICGPTADLLGEKAKRRVERCFEKTAKMTQEAGITPHPVSPKLLLPILQAAAVEEDENLHTMWAALLANAASPDHFRIVRPGFIATLRQLSPEGALFLNELVTILDDQKLDFSTPFTLADMVIAYADLIQANPGEIEYDTVDACMDDLKASHLLETRYDLKADDDEWMFGLTARAGEFVKACRSPKPKP